MASSRRAGWFGSGLLAVALAAAACGGAAVTVETAPAATTTLAPTTSLAGPEGNHAPEAVFEFPPEDPTLRQYDAAVDTTADPPGFGAHVEFIGAASDPDGDPITIEWFSSVEGPIGTGPSTGPVWFHVESDSETRTITMRVTDSWGAWVEITRQINIFILSDV